MMVHGTWFLYEIVIIPTIVSQGSLDMVDELSMVEVKKLLDVVSRLAFSDSSHAALQDELAIMVRKQLSHTDIKYESFFVIVLLL